MIIPGPSGAGLAYATLRLSGTQPSVVLNGRVEFDRIGQSAGLDIALQASGANKGRFTPPPGDWVALHSHRADIGNGFCEVQLYNVTDDAAVVDLAGIVAQRAFGSDERTRTANNAPFGGVLFQLATAKELELRITTDTSANQIFSQQTQLTLLKVA